MAKTLGVKATAMKAIAKKIAKTIAKKIAKKRERVVDTKGLRAAKKATIMTKEEWARLQKGMAERWPAPEYMKQAHPSNFGPMSFRAETFEIMSRMKADTKIAYRPHAKAPGSAKTPNKSHARYEGYMRAKTAEVALECGAWPADWCWDYERGHLWVDTKTLRDEAVDISQLVEMLVDISPVDKAVFNWYRKQMAKKLGLKLKDLLSQSPGESMVMRAHRLVAQREAKAILAECQKKSRRVSDADVTQVLEWWGFARNANRINVMQEGESWVHSDTLGLLRDRCGDIHLTKSTVTYPEVVTLINKWLSDRLPKDVQPFVWTSLNVNKNYAAYIHRDGNNFGPSMISAFGDFTGGNLNYFPDDDGKGDPAKLLKGHKKISMDLSDGLALFNGNSAHSVDDFKGNRFSIVFFALGCHAKMKDAERKSLTNIGFAVPTLEQDPYELLRPPNKKQSVASPMNKHLPASRYWKKASLVSGGLKRSHSAQGE